ncbi:MAG: hypothetical protein FWG73_02015 [Planctomycetaceae bacterium]|nr:hypothetical protein [Planctomycetaceae bacterium]
MTDVLQPNELTTEPNKKNSLRLLGVFADILFTSGVCVAIPVSVWFAYYLEPRAWLPAMVIALLLATNLVAISLAISWIHSEMAELLNRIEELERTKNEAGLGKTEPQP